MILVIVGAVEASQAVELASDAFGDWGNSEQPAVRQAHVPENASDGLRPTVVVPGKTQSDINMGIVGPARKAEDYLAAQLANSVLGEFGMMGRIGKSVREDKGLAYYAYSRLGGGHGPDPWTISAGVNPDNVELAIASIMEEIERLTTEAVTDEDLADNQSYFTGRMPLRLESNEGIASHIHSMESFESGAGLSSELRGHDLRHHEGRLAARGAELLAPRGHGCRRGGARSSRFLKPDSAYVAGGRPPPPALLAISERPIKREGELNAALGKIFCVGGCYAARGSI